MNELNEFLDSVNKAYTKTGGVNWPASGRQLTGSFIKLAAMNQLKQLSDVQKKYSPQEIADLFWSATQMRYILTGEFITGLKLCERDDEKPSLAEITGAVEYFILLLKIRSKVDPFCLYGRNITLRREEVVKAVSYLKTSKADIGLARKTCASLASLSWAFGYDTHFANFMEIHGPYDISGKRQLLVREFNFENVADVWDIFFKIPKRMRFYLLYQNTDITIDWELHTLANSELQLESSMAVKIENGIEQEIDNKTLGKILQESVETTLEQVSFVNSLPIIDKIRKGALLSFLQTKCLAGVLGEDWNPGKDVEDCIVQKGEEKWLSVGQQKFSAGTQNWGAVFDPRIPMK